MSDNDIPSFFHDPSDSSPPSPTPSPSADPSTDPGATTSSQTISADQFAEMQQRLQSAEQWRQDLGRMLLGQQGQAQQQADPQALLQQFLTNPAEVLQGVAEQSVQQAQEAMRNQAIMDDRRAKHPELAKVEHLIDWNSAMQSASQAFYQANHRIPTFAEALDGAISTIKNGLQGILPGAQQPGGGGNRQVMNMDITGGQPANSRAADPFAISDADWPKYRNAFRGQSR